MSVSTYVVGFKPPDEKWKAHKAVWDACEAAGVDIPDETLDFFDHEPPDEAGVEVDLPLREYETDAAEGYELDVSAIPERLHCDPVSELVVKEAVGLLCASSARSVGLN